ncbi:MAG: NAD(P)/FAD-dependent oxidoreductase [Planctomycetota bacterium]
MADRPHVVILGGGFGGLYAARALARADVRITLVDRRNHHLFQPLLYQVATASLAAPDVASPIRKILRRQQNATVLLATATSIDVAARRVELDHGTLAYDYLIVATGSTHSYFGHDDWAQHAPGLKSIADAFEIRRRILTAFEAAERETDAEERKAWLTFVIVGAGPTGVELAGALKEIAQRTLARDFRNFDPHAAQVILVDAVPQVLAAFPETLAARARALLEARGVELRLGVMVTGIDATGVFLGGDHIASRTVLWAAGVKASPLGRMLGAPVDRGGRVLVAADLSVPGQRNVFAIGDLAAVRLGEGWLPGMAPPAIQEGQHAARCIRADLAGAPRPPFRYQDRGMMATIGRSAAVAQIGRWHFTGMTAWLVWLVIHILWLIGFRNRFVVLFEWAFAYFTYQRSARVILEGDRSPAGRA